jgi:2'-5' RNA ligase
MDNHYFTIWLVPSSADREYLGTIIQSISDRTKTPFFIPHLTLYGGLYMPQSELESIINDASLGLSPITVEMDSIQTSENLFKSLYIQIKNNEDLSKLFEKLHNNLEPFPYEFNPHISLMYKTMPEADKQDIIKDLDIKKSFVMNELMLVGPGNEADDWSNVDQWNILYSQRI